MSIVELKNLTKSYKKNRGIMDISFSIEEGEIFGFIGPNGAGKSTTIRTLLNLIYPTSGSATIFGKDTIKHTHEIRQNVGYLPSEVHYYDDMKVIDLLKYSAQFHKKLNSTRMMDLAARLDLDINRKIEDLSFGNRKKVGIVQALLHEPKLIILDEPTSGLDPLIQNHFFDLITEERDKGATIFFSSHILSEVQKMCDRVAIIKEGKLVTVETIEQLTKNKVKNIKITFEQPEQFSLELEGVIKKEVNGNTVALLYNGDIKSLLQHLIDLPVQDVLIEEPTLEEVFMHYYE
ncbi:ABC transporter ATP-binding protein [Bacillus sp. DTU_2020_1000418_1_SI_GHA_SEK_038]|uniref:ABC transporter ATP-binding protein n=1 Tax=Bacillus sp. DTU_2020_1000418_1_SI_GHA_SEK_038 TaxID=3077585 RepID=UPI0028EBD296|nr:ABC transporter ATP-binding protein [Bacillus sp. DTU_2020_1000418_1_SI_GHA_SEK_038]WNS74904.1 ABC transporter ATP-binding protein [Bacillus sp. DTU_2020_1000418_1_SI_GHA_SEK_038]